jgi:hypothetical protein
VCDFRVADDTAIARIVFPKKFIASLAAPAYPIRIEGHGKGWRYRADLGIEHIGYKPMPGNGSLPTKSDDPSVYDWDGDGHPGATLKLSLPLLPDGELRVVQRDHSVLDGRIVGNGRVEGDIDVRLFEQRIIGALPSFLNRSAEIQPDPQGSRFSITPIPPETSCETLRALEPAMSQEVPEEDAESWAS